MVDDSVMNRKMQRQLLAMMNGVGIVEEAADGVEAVAMVRVAAESGTPYELILMDYQMPNMDGGTATRLIREMGHLGTMVGVTGNALPKDIITFKECGVNSLLTKPIRAGDLFAIISGIATE